MLFACASVLDQALVSVLDQAGRGIRSLTRQGGSVLDQAHPLMLSVAPLRGCPCADCLNSWTPRNVPKRFQTCDDAYVMTVHKQYELGATASPFSPRGENTGGASEASVYDSSSVVGTEALSDCSSEQSTKAPGSAASVDDSAPEAGTSILGAGSSYHSSRPPANKPWVMSASLAAHYERMHVPAIMERYGLKDDRADFAVNPPPPQWMQGMPTVYKLADFLPQKALDVLGPHSVVHHEVNYPDMMADIQKCFAQILALAALNQLFETMGLPKERNLSTAIEKAMAEQMICEKERKWLKQMNAWGNEAKHQPNRDDVPSGSRPGQAAKRRHRWKNAVLSPAALGQGEPGSTTQRQGQPGSLRGSGGQIGRQIS